MKKKLISRDLSKVVKAKFVRLLIGNENYNTNTNRWYFQNDGQLDRSIIVGIQVHSGFDNGQPSIYYGNDFTGNVFYNIVTGYADFYNPLTVASPTRLQTDAYLSLVNQEGRFFMYQQPLTSLNFANTGKYPKRLYTRLTLDKCYVETPTNILFGTSGVPSSYYVPFTFYYIDDANL